MSSPRRSGLEDFELGPLVWTRTHLFELGDWDGQVERYYLVRPPAVEPVPQLTWEQLNAEYVTAVRWWTPAELATADAQFAPRRLPLLVRELIMHGAPAEPVGAGVSNPCDAVSQGAFDPFDILAEHVIPAGVVVLALVRA